MDTPDYYDTMNLTMYCQECEADTEHVLSVDKVSTCNCCQTEVYQD